jgi:hypothetical protein
MGGQIEVTAHLESGPLGPAAFYIIYYIQVCHWVAIWSLQYDLRIYKKDKLLLLEANFSYLFYTV